MTILQIRVFPDPILLHPSNTVTAFDDNLSKLSADMVETMLANQGLGLAANQVGVLQRLAVIKLHAWNDAIPLVNPKVTSREGNREVEEACLSLPGYYGIVNRSQRIHVRFQNLSGQAMKLTADCALAQAIEHETDHLNGIMFTDHLIAHNQLFHTHQADANNPHQMPTKDLHHHRIDDTTQRFSGLHQQRPQFQPNS